MSSRTLKSNLDLINECDSFPQPDDEELYALRLAAYYFFCLLQTWSPTCTRLRCVGYILPSVVSRMPWTPNFTIDDRNRTVTIPYNPTVPETAAISDLLTAARQADAFKVLHGWRNELYPILGLGRDITVERAGSALLGIQTIGVHMTAYHRAPDGSLRIWVPRRAKTKQTYGDMLDNSVAGGMAAGEDPLECIIREAGEEASLPAELVRARIKSVGTVSYFHIRDERAGGEIGLLQPETQFAFDLELPPDVVLKPSDDEVQEFYLWGVEEVRKALGEGQFKPNCALYLVDFLVRHGIVTARDEMDYLEIVTRLHRRIYFEDPFFDSRELGL